MSVTFADTGTGGALCPEEAGDGIVVTIRPFDARLRRAGADGIATLAAAHGNGMLDVTARGHLRIRGVREKTYRPLLEGLRRMSLVDAHPAVERRRNVLVTPFWQTGGETEALAPRLTQALSAPDAPDLPATFTFAIDTGKTAVLQGDEADIRLERDAGGGLILVAGNAARGKPVTAEGAIGDMIDLARRVADSGGGAKVMAGLPTGETLLPDGHFVPRQQGSYAPAPDYTPLGAMVGLSCGRLTVKTLASLAKQGGLRFTPWRLMLVEGAREFPGVRGLITDPDDPTRRIIACSGKKGCSRSFLKTARLGRDLAPHIGADRVLHVSGCERGCAHQGAAPLTVVGTQDGLSLVRDGRAWDRPEATGLDAGGIAARL